MKWEIISQFDKKGPDMRSFFFTVFISVILFFAELAAVSVKLII